VSEGKERWKERNEPSEKKFPHKEISQRKKKVKSDNLRALIIEKAHNISHTLKTLDNDE
jgi:hypothetical protein